MSDNYQIQLDSISPSLPTSRQAIYDDEDWKKARETHIHEIQNYVDVLSESSEGSQLSLDDDDDNDEDGADHKDDKKGGQSQEEKD